MVPMMRKQTRHKTIEALKTSIINYFKEDQVKTAAPAATTTL
jgi:hypothetical protein